jgi:TusA-related sulfurtransferase
MNAPPADRLDLRGVRCPANAARALLRLEGLDDGEVLELTLDDGEPVTSVLESLELEGHVVVSRERPGPHWVLRVRARG